MSTHCPAFTRLLRRHVTADFRGHGFMLHKRGTEQELRFLSLGLSQVAIASRSTMRTHLYAHNPQVIDEALGPRTCHRPGRAAR
jgi:hypothetical protein